MNESLTKYWLGDGVNSITSESLIKLASHRRAIANMIRIITKKNIPVKFNLIDKSFMTKNIVVISARVTGNSYDSNVGLALHEGTHVAFSDLGIVGNIGIFISKEQREKVTKLGILMPVWLKFVSTILNIVEVETYR